MKVLFLDIDGVVNSRATTNLDDLYPLDRYMAFLVGKIQLDTGCEVVLSSSWRHHPRGIEIVEKHIVKIFDKTPDMDFRGQEISAWLDEHPEVTRHAILDDDVDFHEDQPLFKTSFETGLTDEIAAAVINYLNEV